MVLTSKGSFVRLQLHGVRGSRIVAGPDHVRYGGNTSCVSLALDGAAPTLVLDAGSGLTGLSDVLGGRPFDGSILLSHLHWDHVYGLPFFRAGDRPDARVDLYLPGQGDAEAVLSQMMSPPHFPITPSGLRGAWSFRSLEPGSHDIEGFDVLAVEIPHKGGRTFGYRIHSNLATVVYMPDHGPVQWGDGDDGLGAVHDAALELCRGADLLLHDAQHTVEEFPAVRHFGHSTIDYAVTLARRAGVGKLVLFHHDPDRVDDELDRIAKEMSTLDIDVVVAREGDVHQIG